MSELSISCPGCQSAMRVLKLDEAEVDYCTFCGGAWFDPGEVAAVVGHPLETTPSGLGTLRKCARCQETMVSATLGAVAVEQCPDCHGVFLDQGEIDAVAKRNLGLGAKAVQTTKSLTATCAGCRETFRLGDLMATSKGLGCRRCFLGMDYGAGTILASVRGGGLVGPSAEGALLGSAAVGILGAFNL